MLELSEQKKIKANYCLLLFASLQLVCLQLLSEGSERTVFYI